MNTHTSEHTHYTPHTVTAASAAPTTATKKRRQQKKTITLKSRGGYGKSNFFVCDSKKAGCVLFCLVAASFAKASCKRANILFLDSVVFLLDLHGLLLKLVYSHVLT
jgi:hypothetical protein